MIRLALAWPTLVLRLVCAVRGHALKFNGGDPYCSRCQWRPPGAGRIAGPLSWIARWRS